jgi:hypothetical protein
MRPHVAPSVGAVAQAGSAHHAASLTDRSGARRRITASRQQAAGLV